MKTVCCVAIAFFLFGKKGLSADRGGWGRRCSNSGPRQLFRFASGFAFLEFLAQTRFFNWEFSPLKISIEIALGK